MTTPFEHAEMLALSMVARGPGTHPVEGVPDVQAAIVRFPPNKPGLVEVTFRCEGKPFRLFQFFINAPDPATPTPPAARDKEAAPPTDAALDRLRRQAETNPGDASAWNDLGSALLRRGRAEEAIPALEKSVEVSSGSPIYRLELGLAYSEAKRHADAEKCFAEVAKLDPTLDRWPSHPGVVTLIKLAHARWRQGEAAGAAEALRPAVPLVARILRDLGAYCMDAGRHHDALKFLCAAGGIAPDMEDALHGAGRAFLWLGRTEEAVPWLIEAVTADKKCVDAWYDLGLAFSRLGKRGDARTMFRRALRRNPKHAGALYDLGCLDALDGKFDAAFRNLHRAAKCGWNRVAHVQDDRDLTEIRKDKRWPALVAAMQQAGSKGQPAAPPPF